jgi:Planctomycete cytochrome C/WXXGXW repeat (2 copies)
MTRCQIARLLATSALVVAWAASPSQWLLAAQDPASPTAAAGTPPAKAAATSTPATSDLSSPVDPNLQVLTQGSVHEAFGQPVLFNPGPNPVIPNQPPAAVEELPPDTKPAGNNVEWIPGYWSFEAAQQKFVWTSGIWRVIPPGLAWVPGYWTKSGTGNQWVSGYWRRSETSIALASFGNQSKPNGPTTPTFSNLPDIANSTVPGGPASALNPANAAGTNPAAGGGLDNREAFFDSQIRPVLLGTCAKCHGSTKPRNNLRLDSRAALLKGGDAGPAIVAGDPEKSLLIQAVRYTGDPKMPPNKKLSAAVIADFEHWVRDGAIFPDNAPSVQPATASGTPVAAVTPTLPGNTPTSADTPVAAASDATTLGAVPGLAASPAGPAPAGAPVTAPDDSPTLGAVPTSVDAPAIAAANPTGPGANPASAGPAATAASAAPTAVPAGANPATPNLAAGPATGPRFLPSPPASLESGPVGNPPTPNFTWIPGTWIFRHGRFLWLAGQWSPVHRGWVWVPARYVFTPAGYLFVDGYFDYELAQRGVLFAPVIFRRGFVAPGFVFTPSVVLNTHRLTEFLFVNSPCGCYCFGDYFGANHVQAGIFPWFAFHMSSLGYDPFFAFASWAHHTDIGWHERLVSDFRAFRDDARLRPPRTFEDLERRGRTSGDRFESLAEPFSRFVTRTDPSSLRFERVSRDERGEIDRSLRRFREASSRRNEFETRFARHEPNRENNRDSRFADDRRDFRDDRRQVRDDRRDFRGDRRDGRDDRRESRDDRRESRTGDDRTESRFRDDRRESRIGDERRDSRTADDRREGEKDRRTSARSDDLYLHNPRGGVGETDRREGREQATNRTPPVVSRRPVSTAGLGQRGIQEHPAQRLANPKFVPHPSNRGRSEPAIQNSSNGRR